MEDWVLHKYREIAYDKCGVPNGVWTKCNMRVEPWDVKYQWQYVTCDACRAHPDCRIALAKAGKSGNLIGA